MDKTDPIVIVGAGLAGLTAAIHLSKIGHAVTLIEKNSFPKHKVCGEYISNEVMPYLDWLGVNPEILNPTKIDSIVFSTLKGKTITTNLPLGGFGISRYALDHFLCRKATEQHCTILQETVIDITFDQDAFTLELSNGAILKSAIVLGAYGKRSNIDHKLQRNFIRKKSPWLAVKGHYTGNFSNHVVGLHNFKGGYCGVSKVENNIINICYIANYKSFKTFKSIEEYEEKVIRKNPQLLAVFENSKPVFDKPLTISQISFDSKRPVDKHILMIGDSSGMIHPLCGNGMAMAIRSAKIAAELCHDFCSNTIRSREEFEKQYVNIWNKNFKARLSTGRILAAILERQTLSEWLMGVVIKFPVLLPEIIKRTHGKFIIPIEI